MDFVIFNDTNHRSSFNLSFTSKTDVSRVVISLTLNVKTDQHKSEYDGRIIETNIDTCRLKQGNPFSNIVVNFVMEKVQKYSNFQLECPQKKGNFYVQNFPTPDDAAVFFPNIFQVTYGQWEMSAVVRVKLTAKSTAERGLFMRVRGATVRR